ncbi:hypothetical protein [Mangrovicoccus ximenensis]|uniref:hypothetical protein n=1 Tax=Mangrovicoccus ximenensis TaxID=1911570 RepID=UPI000D36E130|nr:hypothetical protein [Mangrovicoccus ximenensis]
MGQMALCMAPGSRKTALKILPGEIGEAFEAHAANLPRGDHPKPGFPALPPRARSRCRSAATAGR